MSKSVFLFIPAIFILLLAAISSKYQLIPKTTPIPVLPTTVPETAWQTYRNDQRGIEFNYSSDYKIEENKEFVKIGSSYLYFPEVFSEKKLVEQQKACNSFYQPDSQTYENSSNITYYKVCDGYWIVWPANPVLYFELKYKDTSNQILSTFKFTQQTPTYEVRIINMIKQDKNNYLVDLESIIWTEDPNGSRFIVNDGIPSTTTYKLTNNSIISLNSANLTLNDFYNYFNQHKNDSSIYKVKYQEDTIISLKQTNIL